jgi:hypothetical protein
MLDKILTNNQRGSAFITLSYLLIIRDRYKMNISLNDVGFKNATSHILFIIFSNKKRL